MKLTNFIGNEKVVDSLSKLFEGGRFPHALIIEGEDGIGKKTLARDLACTLVCRGDDKPCGECTQCKGNRRCSPGYKRVYTCRGREFFSC